MRGWTNYEDILQGRTESTVANFGSATQRHKKGEHTLKPILIFLAACAAGCFLLVLSIGLIWMSANNREVGLRAQFEAQQKANESGFDKTWKTIQQSAQIPEKERDSFRQTYVEIMNATKGVAGNGQLASFFTQAKIDISPELFKKLMTTIEAERTDFDRRQQKLLDVKREHDTLLGSAPSSLFVGHRPKLEAVIVTSAVTEKAFATGKDDNVDLFK